MQVLSTSINNNYYKDSDAENTRLHIEDQDEQKKADSQSSAWKYRRYASASSGSH